MISPSRDHLCSVLAAQTTPDQSYHIGFEVSPVPLTAFTVVLRTVDESTKPLR